MFSFPQNILPLIVGNFQNDFWIIPNWMKNSPGLVSGGQQGRSALAEESLLFGSPNLSFSKNLKFMPSP
jgi:hypothetical protein